MREPIGPSRSKPRRVSSRRQGAAAPVERQGEIKRIDDRLAFLVDHYDLRVGDDERARWRILASRLVKSPRIWAAIKKELEPGKLSRPAKEKQEKRRRGAPTKQWPAPMQQLAASWLQWVATQRVKSRTPARMPPFRRAVIDKQPGFDWLKRLGSPALSNLIGDALAYLDPGARLVDTNTGLSAMSLSRLPEYKEHRARSVKRVAKLAKHKDGADAEAYARIIRDERLMRAAGLSALGINTSSAGLVVHKPAGKK